jgi:hypothetical protein
MRINPADARNKGGPRRANESCFREELAIHLAIVRFVWFCLDAAMLAIAPLWIMFSD